LETTVTNLTNELNDLRRQRGEFEAVKNQVQHVDTFRNELVKAQQTIKELNEKIEYLQLTPAKRKKIDEANKPKEVNEVVIESSEDTIKDGGSF
jgi:peptidoglycan hydrolase CwlO-like protein